MPPKLPSEPKARGRVILALQKAILATFDSAAWREFGYETGTNEYIEEHPRLLRSLHWDDPDYPERVLEALEYILDADPDSLTVLVAKPLIRDWLASNQPVAFTQLGLSALAPLELSGPAVASAAVEHSDVFICHAGPDKRAVVSPIVAALEREGISHWYDSSEVRWGDSLTAKVNEGLRKSRYVLVVLSFSFHGRPWPERELHAALGFEAQTGASRVLPLLVGSDAEIQSTLQRYPLLADKRYLTWSGEPSAVVAELRQVLDRT
jgi:hypothetical protein